MTTFLLVVLIYLVGAVLAYSLSKGTALRWSGRREWDDYDSRMCVIFGLLSWFGIPGILIGSALEGDRIGFAFRVPKEMRS